MKDKEDRPKSAASLRQQAEASAKKKAPLEPDGLKTLTPEDTRRTLQELQIHQIELEMQNDELRRIQAELDTSRARYVDLYDLAPVGYVTLSDHGLILEANLTAANLLDVTRSGLLKQPLSRYIFTDDTNLHHLHRNPLNKTGAPQSYDLRMVKKDGTLFWAHLTATAAQDQDGAPVSRVVLNDITKRKQAEEALRTSEERYKRITETITDYLYTVRMANGQVVDTTHGTGCLTVTGYHPDEFARDSFLWLRMIVTEDRSRVEEQARRILSGKDPPPIEHRIIHKNGTVRWVRNTFAPHRDKHGALVSYDGLIQDITERKQVEEALRVSEQQHRAMFDLASTGIAQADPHTGQWLRVNRKMCAITGYSADELLRMRVSEVTHPDDRQKDTEAFQQVVRGETPDYHLEKRYMRKDGGLAWVNVNMTVLRDSTGQPTRTIATIEDITKRKQTQEALRASEERFRDLLQNVSAVAVQGYLLDGTVTYWNRASELLYGYTAQEAIGGSLLDLIIPAEMQTGVRQAMQQMAKTRVPIPASELSLRRKDGSRVAVYSSHSIVQPPGHAAEMFCIDIDLTENKRAEEALHESEERWRFAIEGADDGLWDWDVPTNTVFFSRRWKEMLGFAEHEISSSFDEWHKRVHPDDLAQAMADIQAHFVGKTPQYTNEHRIQCKDGSWKWILARGLVLSRDGAGKPLRAIGTHTDITERKHAEETLQTAHVALQRSEALFRRTFDDAPVGSAIVGMDQKYQRVNSAFCRFLGYSSDELIGKTFADITPSEDIAAATEGSRRLLAGEIPTVEMEKRYRRKDGRIIWGRVSMNVVRDATGQSLYLLPIIQDITERKLAEDALAQSSLKLQEKNDALERFTYTVSHDLKSPLVTIKTFAGYLEKDIQAQDVVRLNEDLKFIHGAAEKMGLLLDELLDLSRVGRKMNPFVNVPLQAVVQEALDLVAGQITQRGVTIRVTAEPIIIHGDRPRLVEVFQNLVDNAVKFMGAQPAPCVEIGTEQTAEGPVIFVRDNGIGIDPRHHAKLFGLFEKLDPHGEGTGIGLALVKRIIEVHGGKIWAESAGIGQGTTFRFTLSGTSTPGKETTQAAAK